MALAGRLTNRLSPGSFREDSSAWQGEHEVRYFLTISNNRN
jgi:hypothetical protein